MRRPTDLPAALRNGAFNRSEALARHLDDNRLRRSDLVAPFRGVHISAENRPMNVRSLCEAYAPRLRPGQYFSHRTAALLWVLPASRPRSGSVAVDVSVSAGEGWPPDARGARGHVVGGQAPEVKMLGGLPVCDVASTWIQLGRVAGLDELIALGDAAVFRPRYPKRGDARPFTDLTELKARLNGFRGRGKRRLGAALDLVREGVESPMETALRLLLIRGGLPEPDVNVDIPTRSGGSAGRADLYYPKFRLVVEYDGEQHRLDREVYAEDQRRIARLIEAGETVQRVRVEGLRSEAPLTLSDVRTALTAAGWRPPNSHRLGSSGR